MFQAICLFFAVIFTCSSLVAAGQSDPTREPSSTTVNGAPPITLTPTIDRLAAPPTVFPATQADDGAQLFWLYCQPCHGDQGQGLTDEWRAQYPEEHQNCWGRGCHAESPYPEGFTLPTSVPAVIGEESLSRFASVGQLYHYIRLEMPFEYPGSLTEEEYLAITAFLARAHLAGDGQVLTIDNVAQIALYPRSAIENEEPMRPVNLTADENNLSTPEAVAAAGAFSGNSSFSAGFSIGAGFLLILLLSGGGWMTLRKWRVKKR